MQAEFRQRLLDGAYQIRGYGINQLIGRLLVRGRPATGTSAAASSERGQFASNDKWVWGWEGVALLSDYFVLLPDYRL